MDGYDQIAREPLSMHPEVSSILADPSWLAYRYDRSRDEVHFVWLSRESRRNVGFLTQPELTQEAPRRVVKRTQLPRLADDRAPLHLILHSGLTGSTLLTRAFDQEGVCTTLSEPPILTDIVNCHLAGGANGGSASFANELVGLLARPFEPNEAVIVKVGAISNQLGPTILGAFDSTRALCLHAPLPIFLASMLRKGLWGRVWGRRLFATLNAAHLTDFGYTQKELFEQTDLQISALGWLALHRLLGRTVAQFADRTRVLDSETLFANPISAIAEVAKHLDLTAGIDEAAINRVLDRHAKSGEAYNPDQRAEDLKTATVTHAEEIELVDQWIRQVAGARGIKLDLPNRIETS